MNFSKCGNAGEAMPEWSKPSSSRMEAFGWPTTLSILQNYAFFPGDSRATCYALEPCSQQSILLLVKTWSNRKGSHINDDHYLSCAQGREFSTATSTFLHQCDRECLGQIDRSIGSLLQRVTLTIVALSPWLVILIPLGDLLCRLFRCLSAKQK